ncbi:polo-like kinase 1 [Nematocida minor]|uniref:polo-like kinase 1 n=1 Tax=Nematocida minor TaxID=1912983 RepID=UPI002220D120|nr:polo-like kinase 1 [Nematocida minor]KAI5191070.1 polo-like kinase 1 [Nematocida minor]
MKNPPFLPIGSIIYNRDTDDSFEITAMIGRGGFAQCFSVRNLKTQVELAAKIIKKTELIRAKNKQKLLSEIKIHLSVNHKNIVKLFTYFEDKDFVFLIMEICRNKSMMDFLKRNKLINEKHVRIFLLQIISALDYLHRECSVVHRDMKLANLFLDDDFNIKVGDFGLAAVIDREERKKTICGTPNYIAPEVLFGSEDGHSFEVDIWSVGVIVYTMIVGKPPFQKSDVKEIYKSIKTNSYEYPEDCKISRAAKELITGLLELDPKKRYTLEQIYNSDFIRSEPVGALKRPIPSYAPASAGVKTENGTSTISNARSTQTTINRNGNDPTCRMTGTIDKNISEVYTATSQNYNSANRRTPPSAALRSAPSKLGLLSSVHMTVLSLLGNHNNNSAISVGTSCPNDFVSYTVDYTDKYGLGYILVSGTVGVLFNDGTSLVLRKSAVDAVRRGQSVFEFEYFEHKVYGTQKIITKEKYSTKTISSKLEKKVLLINYFIQGLFRQAHSAIDGLSDESTFVIKHVNFARGPVLRLSNRVIVFIVDTKILVFHGEGKHIYYGGNPYIERETLIYCHEVLSILLRK